MTIKKKIFPIKKGTGFLTIPIILLIIYSVLIEPNLILTNRIVIANDDLFTILRDKKVIQISDLHVDSFGYREKKMIEIVNRIYPDIIFVTGDFLVMGRGEDECIEVLRNINMPPYGIYVVLGNADLNTGDECYFKRRRFVKKLKQLGIHVLENQRECLDFTGQGDCLFILGIEGPYLSQSKLSYLLKDISEDLPVILLSHYPDVINIEADALTVNLEEEENMGVNGWDWQDNAFFEFNKGIVRFEKDGHHTVRVQRREDGVAIQQICLVATTDISDSDNENILNKKSALYSPINPYSGEMIIIKAEDIDDRNIYGCWKKVRDSTINSQVIIQDMPDRERKNEFPLATPRDYFDASFYAKSGIDYHIWIRMKAHDDLISNDSIYLQFNDSVNREGEPIYRIKSASSLDHLKRIDLILAGHTHGGQVRFPIIGSLNVVPGHNIKYDMGLFKKNGTKMYVNRGIGTAILPIRFLCPPEITIFGFTKG